MGGVRSWRRLRKVELLHKVFKGACARIRRKDLVRCAIRLKCAPKLKFTEDIGLRLVLRITKRKVSYGKIEATYS